MADFTFTSNTASNLDDSNTNVNMDPTDANEGTITQSEEVVTSDAVLGNPPVNNDNDPFVNLGALTSNFDYDPSLPVSDVNDPFMGYGGFAVNNDYNPIHRQTENQQAFQEGASFNANVGLAPETNQAATNLPAVDEENWLNLTNEEQDEEFQRLMEMSPEEFDKIMRAIPSEATRPLLATPYAISTKRARRDEDDSAPNTFESAPLEPQPAFEPQQIHQIRQIRAAKSQQGKTIEALQKKGEDLEAELARFQVEANDAFENGRMVALLGLQTEWEAKEAKIKADAETEHQNQVGAIRTFLEGQISEGKDREETLAREANSAFEQLRGQLEEANRQLAENDKRLDQFQAEAEAYKANVEREANEYKHAAEEELETQKKALEATEIAKNLAESHLSEKTRALALAKPYVEGLEEKVANLERLDEAKSLAENARAGEQKLLEESRSYAKELEERVVELEKEQSADRAEQQGQEEELECSGAEAAKALEGKIRELEEKAEEAKMAMENSSQATKGLNEELRRISADLVKAQSALKTKTDDLERARSAIEEQANYQKPPEPRETLSVVRPMEQINVEPSESAHYKMPSVAKPFTFVAATELPPSIIKSRQIKAMKSRRQPQSHLKPEPEPQREKSKKEKEQEAEPTTASPPQSGMFSRHFYSPSPATVNRPKRSQIHAEEAIRTRFHIPLGKVHNILSKLDQVGDDWQDGMKEEKAGLIISAELTGLSIDDLQVMQSLRMSVPAGCSSRRKSRKVMSAAQLEIPSTLVDLLATNNRPAISAFLDGASFLQPSQASSADAVAGESESRGTQTEARDAEAEKDVKIPEGQGKIAAMVLPKPKQTRRWQGSGFASPGKMMIFLCILYLILPLLLPSPWSSPAAWIFENPDPNSGWLNYEPEPSAWSNLLLNISGWPVISKFLDIFFDLPDLESKWCGNIPMG